MPARSSGFTPAFQRLFPWFPVALAGGYLIWLVSNLSGIVKAIQLNPDATWAPVLVRDLAEGVQGGLVYVGEASHFSTIWFLMATRGLVFRDLVWDAGPFVLFLAGLLVTAWAAWMGAGWWVAVLGFCVGASAGARVLLTILAEGLHGHTFVTNAVLAAFLVLYYTRAKPHWVVLAPAAAVVVAMAGATLASDPLFIPSGLIPFAAAPVAVWIADPTRRNRTLAATALALTALTVAVGFALGRWMVSQGYRKTYATEGYTFATPVQAVRNLGTFVVHAVSQGNGFYPGQEFRPALDVAAGMVMTVFLAAAVVFPAVRLLKALKSRPLRRRLEQPVSIYVTFWVLSALGMAGAFALSTFATGPSDNSRYVLPAFFALAAAAVLPARRPGWGRVAVAAGVGLFCLLSIANRNDLFGYREESVFRAPIDHGAEIVEFLESERATVGYAGYFNSHPLTYASGMRAGFYPVIRCRYPESNRLCPFSVNTRTAWSEARPDVRSFVLADDLAPEIIAAGPLPEFGEPVVTRRFGSVSVYVYDYDIASRLAPPCPLGSPEFTCPGDTPD
ncbi:MAG TPA: hypothetical protein VEU28_00490 [Actinomycetota bacterium]|nr:hypothetical protein [Actinomycetota bacterium]